MYQVLLVMVLSSAARTEAATAAELTYEIFEELASNTLIGNVARDLKLHESVSDISNLKFSLLTKGNLDSILFTVDELTGDLHTSQLIDRESICNFLEKCELNFEVAVQSNLGSFFKKVSVGVTILDINDNAPKFSPDHFQLTISEGSGIGTTFPIVKAIDQDTDVNNSVHSYELFTNTDMFSLEAVKDFWGDFNDVSLKLVKKLDREIQPVYHLSVIARDNANPPKTGTLLLTVTVGDINDNDPLFEHRSYSLNVSESLSVDGLILTLNASDNDVGANADISFYFTPRQPERVLELFKLDSHTGELRTAKPLNTSVGEVFELLAEARDNGSPVLTTQIQISIRVLDTHNNPPIVNVNVFSSSGSAEVSESSSEGRAVAHIGVNDPDSGMNGIVNCSISHDYITISQLDVNEYKAILARPLDRESVPQHIVGVVCYDYGNPALTTSVEFTVKVLDENDNTPVFSQSRYYASIVENNFINQVITSVSAVDYDAGVNAKISYAIVGDSTDSFNIFSNGTVVATKQLDRETTPVVRLQVTATDNGAERLTATAMVEISLEDLNDKRPQFNKSVFYFDVSENLLPGNNVGRIGAFDRDLNENAELSFSISKHDSNLPFICTPDGMIETTESLDRESKNRYSFVVTATDKGEPPLSSSVGVVIMVKDLNDQSPIILYPNDENNTVSIPNSYAPKTGFSAIVAYDLDQGTNNHLKYYLKDANSSNKFFVNPITGEIFTKKVFGPHEVGIHHLVLIVKDQGSPIRSTVADLYVQVYSDGLDSDDQYSVLTKQNVITVAVIVCITIILGVIVGITIFFLRRRDKQKRIYNAKREETRVIASMKQYESTSSESGESSGALSSQCSSSESVSSCKKKEVSFSFVEDNNLAGDTDGGTRSANKVEKTMFNQLSDEQLIFQKIRNSGQIEPPFNRLSPYLYHQKPTLSINDKEKIDSASVTSGEVSTSDSGRGGSDVDICSHTASHDSRELFFTQARQSFRRHSTKRPAPLIGLPNDHFYDQSRFAHPDMDQFSRPSSSIIGQPSSKHLQTINHPKRNNNSAPTSNNNSVRFQSRSVPGRYGDKREVTFTPENKKQSDDGASIYVEMRTPMSSSYPSTSVCDDSKCETSWGDNSTSTSGSYTVDADELCQEIDKLFFKESDLNGDIIV